MKKIVKYSVVIGCLFYIYSCKTSIISYYSFNADANNSSVYKIKGIVEGATLSPDRNGRPNSSYYFDGKQSYIRIRNFGDIVPTEEITVSMWVKSLGSKTQFQMMLCPDNNRLAVSINYFHDGRNTVFWDYGWQGEGGDAPGRLYYRPEPLDTLWHHYVFVSGISENQMKIYKDKVLLTDKTEPRVLLNPAGKDLIIGSGDKAYFFKGYIDDIRIYNKALNSEEIEKLFQY